jgi:nucleoside-diphosphate-sugar epimerase
MTRSPGKAELLRKLGAEPIVVDVYDAAALRDAAVAFEPDLLMHQLTDLPDEVERIPEMSAANARIRTEGTRNLLAAAEAAGAPRFLARASPGGSTATPTARSKNTRRWSSTPGGVAFRSTEDARRIFLGRPGKTHHRRLRPWTQTLIVITSPSRTT